VYRDDGRAWFVMALLYLLQQTIEHLACIDGIQPDSLLPSEALHEIDKLLIDTGIATEVIVGNQLPVRMQAIALGVAACLQVIADMSVDILFQLGPGVWSVFRVSWQFQGTETGGLFVVDRRVRVIAQGAGQAGEGGASTRAAADVFKVAADLIDDLIDDLPATDHGQPVAATLRKNARICGIAGIALQQSAKYLGLVLETILLTVEKEQLHAAVSGELECVTGGAPGFAAYDADGIDAEMFAGRSGGVDVVRPCASEGHQGADIVSQHVFDIVFQLAPFITAELRMDQIVALDQQAYARALGFRAGNFLQWAGL